MSYHGKCLDSQLIDNNNMKTLSICLLFCCDIELRFLFILILVNYYSCHFLHGLISSRSNFKKDLESIEIHLQKACGKER
jgi:hypothetical protein